MPTTTLASFNASTSLVECQDESNGLLAAYERSEFAKELQSLFNNLEDEELLDALHKTRRTGRPGYPIEVMWKTYIAGYYLNIPTFTGLIRELKRNPCLAYLCGIETAQDVPTKYAYCRFLKKLVAHKDLVERCCYKLVRRLNRILPGFGRDWAIDSTAIHAYSRPRKAMLSDPEAGWGYEKDKYGNQRKFYGYRAHIIADVKYELPINLAITPANVADSVVASTMLRQTKSKARGLRPKRIIGDPGYDSAEIHETIVALGAAPIIKLNPRKRGVGAVPEGRSYRLYPGVPLDPKAWQKHYNKRTAVERVNSRLKEFAKLDNLKVRGLAKIQLHGLLAMLMLQAKALATVATL
ncbi:transposase [Dehalococcoidales bacterium]|nr:transposase [Dehalococcoidales bacterium]